MVISLQYKTKCDLNEEEMKLYEFGKKVTKLMEKNCPTNEVKKHLEIVSTYNKYQEFDVYPSETLGNG